MTSFEPGGTERQMIELVRRLDPARWSVHLACFHARGAWFGRVAEAVESVGEFPVSSFKRLDTLGHLAAFARWCRERRIAIVQTTEIYSNIFGLPGAALARVSVRVGSRRGMNDEKPRSLVELQRFAYGCAHRIVANSYAGVAQLISERVPGRKVAVIPNGLDLASFRPRMRATLPRKVAVVANLLPDKGHDMLIDAAVDVLGVQPDATFHLIGDGPERDGLMARCEARGVRQAFTFAGHREDVPARLADADIFALPSRSEALPNAVLEAMAAGLPVVASRVGGIPELIDDGRTGLLVPAGDVQALADAFLRIMAEPELASRLGRAARADVEARYSSDRMAAAFDALYSAALASRAAAPAARAPVEEPAR